MASPHAAATPPAIGELGAHLHPRTLAGEQVLPVLDALRGLLPWDGLARGVTVGCGGTGATSLALGLVAAATAAGSWVAVVDMPWLGLAAAEQAGVVLGHLAMVDPPATAVSAHPHDASHPGGHPRPATAPRPVEVVAALVGAVDIIVLCPLPGLRPADARRLGARCRERGTTLVVCDRPTLPGTPPSPVWPEGPDVRLTGRRTRWSGLGAGHGYLRARQVHVEATGRRAAARPRSVDLWLPDPDGRITVVAPQASVTTLSGTRSRRPVP